MQSRNALAQMLWRVRAAVKNHPDRFLGDVSGVIHVGANSGQERMLYAKNGLRVVWLEPIPEVFERLKNNLEGFPEQRAFQYLVADRDDVEYQFNVASNEGASSSILDLGLHRDIWPDIRYERTVRLRSKTLPSVLAAERVDVSEYDALVMDTQGSELLVLQGAASVLARFKYIKTEAPDFESYVGCCQLPELTKFLSERGYEEYSRHKFAERPQGGAYYDVVYRRSA